MAAPARRRRDTILCRTPAAPLLPGNHPTESSRIRETWPSLSANRRRGASANHGFSASVNRCVIAYAKQLEKDISEQRTTDNRRTIDGGPMTTAERTLTRPAHGCSSPGSIDLGRGQQARPLGLCPCSAASARLTREGRRAGPATLPTTWGGTQTRKSVWSGRAGGGGVRCWRADLTHRRHAAMN